MNSTQGLQTNLWLSPPPPVSYIIINKMDII